MGLPVAVARAILTSARFLLCRFRKTTTSSAIPIDHRRFNSAGSPASRLAALSASAALAEAKRFLMLVIRAGEAAQDGLLPLAEMGLKSLRQRGLLFNQVHRFRRISFEIE
jgi:hypothetical protein